MLSWFSLKERWLSSSEWLFLVLLNLSEAEQSGFQLWSWKDWTLIWEHHCKFEKFGISIQVSESDFDLKFQKCIWSIYSKNRNKKNWCHFQIPHIIKLEYLNKISEIQTYSNVEKEYRIESVFLGIYGKPIIFEKKLLRNHKFSGKNLAFFCKIFEKLRACNPDVNWMRKKNCEM